MCRAVMAERSGESANDASDTVTIGTKRWQGGKKFGEKDSAQGGREADTQTHDAEASSGRKAGARDESCSGSAGAGAVQAVQERVGGDRGTHPERARYALRMSVLPEVAPSAWSGAGI